MLWISKTEDTDNDNAMKVLAYHDLPLPDNRTLPIHVPRRLIVSINGDNPRGSICISHLGWAVSYAVQYHD